MTDGKRARLAFLVLLILISCSGATTEQDPPGTTAPGTAETTTGTAEDSVVMENVAFRPDELTVAVGATVTWTNQDLVTHTTTSDDDLWDSESLGQSDSFSFTFEESGTYTYICTIHPAQMQGTVTVED